MEGPRSQASAGGDNRLDEIEIKLAFLEKELDEYKEASRGFYRRLAEMEAEMRAWKRDPPDSPQA